MVCDIPAQAGERGLSCKKMCLIQDHKVFHVRFMCLQTYLEAKFSCN